MRSFASVSLLLVLVAVAGACDADPISLDAGSDAAIDAGLGPVSPVFDPGVLDGAGPFFDMPYPSDLRTDAAGHPDLSGFPRARGLIADGIAIVEAERAGFSPITGVYFRFTGPLDPASLPSDPADTEDASSPILLVDIDEGSPERGRRLPAYVRFMQEGTRFWPGDALVVRPVPGLQLHPGRRYAVVVTDGVRAADGAPLEPSSAFASIESSGGAIGAHYTALFAELASQGIAREAILSATAFTVSDPAAELDLARAFVDAQEIPTVRDWNVLVVRPDETRYEAVFDTYELMQGEPPFMEFGSGTIAFDADGAPLSVRRRPVEVGLTVPNGAAPAGGIPLVLYGHGTGGDHRTHFGDEGSVMVEIGVAMLGFEAALHGDRNPSGFDVSTLVVANPIGAREMIRQTVIDQMIVLRMMAAGAFDLPAEVTSSEPIAFARSPVMYMGHSQGSQEGGVLLGVEPSVQAAFLSEGGGGGIITILEREIRPGQSLRCLVAGVLSESCEVLTEDHPALTLIVQPLLDPADPLSFAHRFHRERPVDWAPLSLAMTEGDEDTSTPPRTIEALAASIGLPIVEPVVQRTDPYRLLALPSVTPPVSGNLMLPSGDAVTGGLMQWSGVGHYVIYSVDDAQNRYREFFRTMVADGVPTLVAPP